MGQKQPQQRYPSRSNMQQTRMPTSDERTDADDMDSDQTDLTQRSGAHRQQDADHGEYGSLEPGTLYRHLR